MAEPKSPMRFGPEVVPNTDEQFARMPVSPADQLKNGGSPEKWSPGLGDGTAPVKTGSIPWPSAKVPPSPFRNLK